MNRVDSSLEGISANLRGEGGLSFVIPAKAGVQSRGFKLPDPQIDNVYLIMDSLVTQDLRISASRFELWI